MANASGEAVEAVDLAKGRFHDRGVEGRGLGEVLNDGSPRTQPVFYTAGGDVDALVELAGRFVIVATHGLHQVRVTVEGHAADDGQADVRVNGVDEVAVGVKVVRIDDRQIGGHAWCNSADVILPVGRVRCVRGDHADHLFVGEDVAKDFVVPQVGDLQFMER